MFCILNYDSYYTLDPDVNFTVVLEGNFKHMTCICVLLKWHKVKRPKPPLSQSIKTKISFFIFTSLFLFLSLSPIKIYETPNPQNKNHQWHHHCSTIAPSVTFWSFGSHKLKNISRWLVQFFFFFFKWWWWKSSLSEQNIVPSKYIGKFRYRRLMKCYTT